MKNLKGMWAMAQGRALDNQTAGPAPSGRLNQLLLALVAATLLALAWNEYGMNSALVIAPDGPWRAWTDDDRRESGGQSVASLQRSSKGFQLACDVRPGYEYPYCEIAIALREAPAGIDLSDYRVMRVWLSYQGVQPQQPVRVYLCNFNPAYSHVGDSQSLKTHELALDPRGLPMPLEIDLAKFSVASWWISEHNVPMEHAGIDLSNVSVIRVGTGNNTPAGRHRIDVQRIEFQGKLISKATFRLVVLAAWMLGIFVYVVVDASSAKRRLRAVEQSQLSLRRINAALHLRTRDYAEQANRDPLTNLLNRRGLGDELLQRSRQGEPALFPMALLFIDIDHFKRINDRHGHAVGDAVLRCVADALRAQIQRTDLLARWGGEEFVLLCPATRVHEAQAIAERLRHAIEALECAAGVRLTASFGVAEAANPNDLSTGINRADAAVYAAKNAGRNRVEVHSEARP